MLVSELNDLKDLKEAPWDIIWMFNMSEEFQLSFVENLKYENDCYDKLVYKYIISSKAIALYEKLKKVHMVVKLWIKK
jgi:hypothetical protein